jgi:(p)ppGpp synthase/HD superfamily hydrolase
MVESFVRAMPEFANLDEQTQSDALAAAWLHDVLEDTDETAETLLAAGISDRAVAVVVVLTRMDDLTSDDYYAVIRVLPVPLLVKTADLASNLAPERVAQLDEHSRARLARKYRHALEALGVDRSVIAALHGGSVR